ncbi:chemotaxis protein CheD [Rhabdochromatium marinum]|uniref:chemotaxis protein CheD n=1 Tax=Rhabdochromatium marinum TaxID=48729 RepID=UPI0019076566|nr:chemotaxis protein CheD [Rhabdochromatium marinum]MBK1647815.1 chemotaxis protein CheD [Rhabdochromatium marinum]
MNAVTQAHKPIEKRVIHAGEHHVSRNPIILSTLLGSCVSVCLYDPVTRVVGMNHFLLATRHPSQDPVLASDAGRYGLGAMELLINDMLKLGARRANLRAKAFGGGNVLATRLNELPDRFSIGKINIDFVQRFLAQDRIPLVAQDFGGTMGRQIRFESNDFSVYLRRIPIKRTSSILTNEKRYFDKELKQQKAPRSNSVEFW